MQPHKYPLSPDPDSIPLPLVLTFSSLCCVVMKVADEDDVFLSIMESPEAKNWEMFLRR